VSTESDVKRRRSQEKKRCQKIGISRERDVNGKRLKRNRCQETAMRSEKTLSGEKSVSGLGLHSCQREGQSRFRDVKGKPVKPDQEKVVKEKEFQEMRWSTAVTARRSGVVPIGSPFSL
jgi:hypothetical protein